MNIPVMVQIASAIRVVDEHSTALFDEMLADRSCVVSFVNAHAVNMAHGNKDFYRALLNANILLRDGIGVQILMRTLGNRAGDNMNGTDFIPRILEASRSRSLAVFGSTGDIAEHAAAKIRLGGTATVMHCDGFQSLEHYVDLVLQDRPRVVVLGMGMPKQELVADAIVKASTTPVLIINGGAILDFLSGRFERAPLWIRRIGMEWLFRLCCEPRRLWRRYLVGNVVFLVRIMLMARHNRQPQTPALPNGPAAPTA